MARPTFPLLTRFCVLCAVLIVAMRGNAQSTPPGITSSAQAVTGDTMMPGPGGHDYVKLLSETVNPSNGSVSYRVDYPMPKGRGISVPYWFSYSTAGRYRIMSLPNNMVQWVPNFLASGSTPIASWQESTLQPITYQCGQYPSNTCDTWPCNYANGFTFTGLDGVSHNLGIGAQAPATSQPTPDRASPCGQIGNIVPGTDGEVSAQFTDQAGTLNLLTGWGWWQGGSPSGSVGAFTVTDKNGTTYFFGGGGTASSTYQVFIDQPYKIEDRNGNLIGNTSGWVDTLGRQIGYANSTVGGITYPPATPPPAAPSSVTVNYSVPNSDGTNPCFLNAGVHVGQVSGTQAAWNAVPLPDGTQYTLFFGSYNPYDAAVQNNYGLLNEVKFPGGGWIKYQYSIDTQVANELAAFPNLGTTVQGITNPCFIGYSTPRLAHRYVSYDGVNLAQQQDFTYSTNWGGSGLFYSTSGWSTKTTSVTTTDKIRNKSTLTIYTYGGASIPGNSPFSPGYWGSPAPVEQSVQYFDWENISTPIKTVTKTWNNVFQLACEFTTINGMTSGHVYKYMPWSSNYISDYMTEEREFDYSQVTGSNQTSICNGTSGLTPYRKTATSYQSFTDPLIPSNSLLQQYGAIFYKPQSVITYDKTGARVAESDFAYDGSSLAPASAIQSDSNYSGGSITVRGNVTSVTRQCFTASGNCATPTIKVTGTYDTTGQLVSRTDPCGNSSCGDMTGSGHTTQFYYNDVGTNLPSSPGSNAYVTKIVYPQTGTVVHQETFQYNYAYGDLTFSFDENNQQTQYKYECPTSWQLACAADSGGVGGRLDRLIETDSPDGGKTTITYNGATSVTTTQLITSTLTKTVVTNMDGMFHAVSTQLTSDPEGTDTTDTTYDGLGRAWKVANPHRSSSWPTDGTTQTDVDALGRPMLITRQDGSLVHTSYGTPCILSSNVFGVTTVDEAGHPRQSCTDSLGQLVEVDEPNVVPVPAAPGTGGFSVSGVEQGPVQAPNCPPGAQCPVYDTGSVTVTVNGQTAGAGFGQGSTAAAVLASLITNFNSNPNMPATSDSSGYVTAKTVGAITNYPFSVSMTHNSTLFPNPSFTISGSGRYLTGGTDGISPSTAYVTLYNYDGLGNLTCAEQHGNATSQTGCSAPSTSDPTSAWRVRRFTYNSLSQLLTATNPETNFNAIAYTYDLNGNLFTKTDPRSITITYGYDNLNRLTGKTYNNGDTAISYTYDAGTYGIGHRTGMTDASGSSSWTYENTGRVASETQTISGITKTISTTYNLDGSVKQATYPIRQLDQIDQHLQQPPATVLVLRECGNDPVTHKSV